MSSKIYSVLILFNADNSHNIIGSVEVEEDAQKFSVKCGMK